MTYPGGLCERLGDAEQHIVEPVKHGLPIVGIVIEVEGVSVHHAFHLFANDIPPAWVHLGGSER